ncbi:MAG: response regulator [Bacteroidetes bacterium]|nr:response regulator [Bacteroidota bacterium]
MVIKSLMLIDDDGDDRELVSLAIHRIRPDITLIHASNGKEALLKLKSAANLPDLIFLDINMPVVDGFETLSLLKNAAVFKNIPVIMFSTSISEKDEKKAKLLGAMEYFSKPYSYADLAKLLQQIFNGLTEGKVIKGNMLS